MDIYNDLIILKKVASNTEYMCLEGGHLIRVQVDCDVGFHLEMI